MGYVHIYVTQPKIGVGKTAFWAHFGHNKNGVSHGYPPTRPLDNSEPDDFPFLWGSLPSGKHTKSY